MSDPRCGVGAWKMKVLQARNLRPFFNFAFEGCCVPAIGDRGIRAEHASRESSAGATPITLITSQMRPIPGPNRP